MCGLCGGLGVGVDVGIVRSLLILNESRGHDGVGVFNSSGGWRKNNSRSTEELRKPELSRFIEQSAKRTWAVCGHTRGGTRGGAFARNAHPFSYGEIIGSHNGVVDAPTKYDVDSMWIMDLLSQEKPGDYQKALSQVGPWFVLTWLDKRNKSIYLLNWSGQLHFMKYRGVWYYSSDGDHLATAVGSDKGISSIDKKAVIRFSFDKEKGVQAVRLPDFTGKERETVQVDWRKHYREYDGYDSDYVTGYPRHSAAGQNYAADGGRGADPTGPAGWVVKFPTSGLWHARLLNGMYRLIRAQTQLNTDYKDWKLGQHMWLQPGYVRSILTPISPQTPLVQCPPGVSLPPTIDGQKVIVIPEKDASTEDTKILGVVAKSAAGDGQKKEFKEAFDPKGSRLFLDENDQEKADLELAKEGMDTEGAAINRFQLAAEQRHAFLTEVVDLTAEEAKEIMEDEMYLPSPSKV